MDEENSLPVDYTMIELDKDFGPYQKGQVWAEPNLANAAAKMVEIQCNPALAERVGSLAAKRLKEMYSADRIAEIQESRCADIHASL